MNTILKRFVIKEWGKSFLASASVLFILVAVSYLLSKFLRSNVTSTEVIKNFVVTMPTHLNKVLPLSCLLASLFSINKMKSHSELIAIFASGYSRFQVFFTVAQISFLVGSFQFINNSYIIPYTKKFGKEWDPDLAEKFKNTQEQGLVSNIAPGEKIWYRSPDYFFSYKAFDKQENILLDVSLFLSQKRDSVTKIINAKTSNDGGKFSCTP